MNLPGRIAEEELAAAARRLAGSLDEARAAVDAVLSLRGWRSDAPRHAAALRAVAAAASARLDGAQGPEDSSAMGGHVRAIRLLTDEVHRQVDVAERAPAMVIARLHVVATSSGHVHDDHRGRPRVDDEVNDPLHLGSVIPAADARAMLTMALGWMSPATASDIPGIARAATVHGLLAVARPFRDMSGPVARAAGRLVLAMRAVDPDGLIPVEAGIEAVGRAGYVRALRSWIDGDIDPWLEFHCNAVVRAAMIADAQVRS